MTVLKVNSTVILRARQSERVEGKNNEVGLHNFGM